MKKLLIVFLLLFLLVGCKNKDEDNIKSNIVKFSYSYGSYNEGYHNYDIKVFENKIYLTAIGYNGVNLNINKEIENSYLEKLDKIINDNNLNSWDGFNEKDESALDGYGFNLEIEYKSGKKITADGYMKYPSNYDKVHKELESLFSSIN